MHADPGEDLTVEPLPKRVTRSFAKQQESHRGSTRKERLKQPLRETLDELREACSIESSEEDANPLLKKLTQFHDRLYAEADNILTEKVTVEVLHVVTDPSKIDSENREYRWSKNDEEKLNILNAQARNLQTPKEWTWAAKEGTSQYAYNHRRMQYLVQHELQTVVKHCQNCSTTGLLVGLDQVNSAFCIDCVAEHSCRSEKLKTKRKAVGERRGGGRRGVRDGRRRSWRCYRATNDGIGVFKGRCALV